MGRCRILRTFISGIFIVRRGNRTRNKTISIISLPWKYVPNGFDHGIIIIIIFIVMEQQRESSVVAYEDDAKIHFETCDATSGTKKTQGTISQITPSGCDGSTESNTDDTENCANLYTGTSHRIVE
jgi:hypothetical protein